MDANRDFQMASAKGTNIFSTLYRVIAGALDCIVPLGSDVNYIKVS